MGVLVVTVIAAIALAKSPSQEQQAEQQVAYILDPDWEPHVGEGTRLLPYFRRPKLYRKSSC